MVDDRKPEDANRHHVRLLDWVETRDGTYEISSAATTSIGRYEAWYFRLHTDPPRDCYGWKGPFTADAGAESYEAAVAAAQEDYVHRILGGINQLALVAVASDVRQWWHFPIEMPLTDDGNGPALVGSDAVKISYEVWDRENVSYGSYDYLSDAINESMRLNSLHSPVLLEATSQTPKDWGERRNAK